MRGVVLKYSLKDVQKVRALYDEGLQGTDIARLLHLRRGTVWYLLNRRCPFCYYAGRSKRGVSLHIYWEHKRERRRSEDTGKADNL